MAIGLRAPKLAAVGARSPIVSDGYLKYSHFRETATGDRIRSELRGGGRSPDRHCHQHTHPTGSESMPPAVAGPQFQEGEHMHFVERPGASGNGLLVRPDGNCGHDGWHARLQGWRGRPDDRLWFKPVFISCSSPEIFKAALVDIFKVRHPSHGFTSDHVAGRALTTLRSWRR